jgi:isoquinoline 1-oxidoreductase alpha subunit
MIELTINKKLYHLDVDPEMPLLWVIRDIVGLTGTKFGCGVAQCGACTIHLNGESVRSCVTRAGRAHQQEILTIEGLSAANEHPLQQAWLHFDVPQCGYCQSGQMMSAARLLKEIPQPTDKDIDDAMSGNLCRCGTYQRIKKAIHYAAELQLKGSVTTLNHSDTNKKRNENIDKARSPEEKRALRISAYNGGAGNLSDEDQSVTSGLKSLTSSNIQEGVQHG